MSAKGRAVAKAAKPKTAAAPKEPYNPAKIILGDVCFEDRDKDKVQHVVKNPDDTDAYDDLDRLIKARALIQPEIHSAEIIQRFEPILDINHVARELRYLSSEVRDGKMDRAESMLVAQAHSLDALFANLSKRAHANIEAGFLGATEAYLRLALRAQNQCRSTLETLSAIKNPPVVFAKQMNVANGPQQVNNGIASNPPPVAKDIPRTLENETKQNELGERHHELLENSGASRLTGRAVQEPQTVGAIHRAED